MATTASTASVTTGTAIKTMLQIATPSTRQIQIISWGFSLESPGGDGAIELIQTDVAATVTAHAASGVQPLSPGLPASLMTLGTTATGFTATNEGTPTATVALDVQSLSSTSGESPLIYTYQWMPDERFVVAVSKFLRVRAYTPAGATNMRCWICWDE
jgi:hypothetical protein